MPARTKTVKPADSAGIADVAQPDTDDVVDEPAIPDKVPARYVGIEPVMAHFNGEAILVEPGDLIMVSAEQLEQNPVFQPWED